MPIQPKLFKYALRQALNENGFTANFEGDNELYMDHKCLNCRILSLLLIISYDIDINIHGSHHNNKTDGIGVFRFNMPTGDQIPDYFIFAFENMVNGKAEFVTIKYSDLVEHLSKRNRIRENKAELWLWLMPDRSVYDATDISIEGEWYNLIKGSGGRMADGEEMDYTQWLNNWDCLTDSL